MGGSEDRSGAASIRSSEGEHQEGHVRSTYCRNRSAAYSPFASVLNSENVKSHAEGMLHGPRVWWALINDFRSLERCAVYGCWACDRRRRYWHSRFLQAYSRHCRVERGRGRWTQVEKDSTWRSARRSKPSWARLIALTRPDHYRRHRRWHERLYQSSSISIINQIDTLICFQKSLSTIREYNNRKSI